MRKFYISLKKPLTPITKLLKNRWFWGSVIFFLVAIGIFIAIEAYMAPSLTNFNQRKEFIQVYAQVMGGILLLIGLYLTWRRVEVAQQGQITERFTRAIDQLGSEKLEVRLGGIYALERIARDSKKDHWQIMEILTAYVRKNAPWKQKEWWEKEKKPSNKENKPIFPPPTDIQAVLTIIGRRKRTFGTGEDQRLDLSETNLKSANLIKAHLEEAYLVETNLDLAYLREAHLEGVRLIGASLVYTRLERAQLKGADLRHANLAGTHLDEAHLAGANLSDAINLTKEQIESAIIDENTKLPDYLEAPAKPKKREKQEGKKKDATSKRR